MHTPTFFQLKGTKTYFQIISENCMEELKLIGESLYSLKEVSLSQYSDRLYFMDMMENSVSISKQEYQQIYQHCILNLKAV